MKITILSDAGSWKNPHIADLSARLRRKGHHVVCRHEAAGVGTGDILFILGFFQIVPREVLARHQNNIVVHESALPKGRGWSPMSWLLAEGARQIPLTLFEAVEKVDAGPVYLRATVKLKGDDLLPDIRERVGPAMMRLCETFVAKYPGILKKGTAQRGTATYYPKRKPENSRLNPHQSIARQFKLLRTVDNEAYPAFFTYQGSTYRLTIEKKKN